MGLKDLHNNPCYGVKGSSKFIYISLGVGWAENRPLIIPSTKTPKPTEKPSLPKANPLPAQMAMPQPAYLLPRPQWAEAGEGLLCKARSESF